MSFTGTVVVKVTIVEIFRRNVALSTEFIYNICQSQAIVLLNRSKTHRLLVQSASTYRVTANGTGGKFEFLLQNLQMYAFFVYSLIRLKFIVHIKLLCFLSLLKKYLQLLTIYKWKLFSPANHFMLLSVS